MTPPPSSPLLYLLFLTTGTPARTVRYHNTELSLTLRLPHTSRTLKNMTAVWNMDTNTGADWNFAITLKGPRQRGLAPGRETGTSVLLFQG